MPRASDVNTCKILSHRTSAESYRSYRMNPTHSSQNFVRSLKLASDPPSVGGLFKIEIAQQAWDDASFYVPSKAEVIADWILVKFLKDKGKEMYRFFCLFFCARHV